MGSKTTTALAIRVKNGSAATLRTFADECALTTGQLVEAFTDAIEEGEITVDNGKIVVETAVTPTFEPPELYDDESELYHELHFDKLVKAMREKGYPDRAIRDKMDSFVDFVRSERKYNAKRDSGEYGC